MTETDAPVATTQDGRYPRPQMVRSAWHELSGAWDFAVSDALDALPEDIVFDREITVPFPPESSASGIHHTDFLPSVWYRRQMTAADLVAAGRSDGRRRTLLHFGAVDHTARVWVNGRLVATHEGGQTPFTADITRAVDPRGANEIVVHAVDLPHDVSALRGKQDWRRDPHSIWYERTTGIWQPVWLECVADVRVVSLAWRCDLATATVEVDLDIEGVSGRDCWAVVRLHHDGRTLAETHVRVLGPVCPVRIVLPSQLNGQAYEDLLWSPDRPTLIDAEVRLVEGGAVRDVVGSYVGLRSVAVSDECFLLNDRPLVVRAVLAQNYWPDTLLAATPDRLRREVEHILELGFNTARIHQKAEDPRFLYWADRLGLMVWGETASAYAFDDRAILGLVDEWSAIVRRDRSHPCIVVWVPINESWGVQHLAHEPRQRALSRSVADLTRALDGTRPVISNDGWEHTRSDILSIHDYEPDPAVLHERYADEESVRALIDGFGPAGRRTSVDGQHRRGPLMLTEFGGVSLATDGDAWGYSLARDTAEFETRVGALLEAARTAAPLAGFCYTQLTDTGQETNGLLYADRTPKFPVERVRRAVRGA